ncbi:cytochrome P450, partial [Staphylotrichum tortipilum]
LFRQVLIEIARYPGLVEPLKDEVTEQLSAHGVSVAATSGMALLDSVMKESQRQSSGLGMLVLERIASNDTALPDGRVIPRGSHIMVDATGLWNPAVYPSPDQFDGHRFLRRSQDGDKSSQFVQSSPDYNVFGGGRHICPGRFFASNELKLALAYVLLKYEIRLAKGCEPKNPQHGFYGMVDPSTQLEVRRKDGRADGGVTARLFA